MLPSAIHNYLFLHDYAGAQLQALLELTEAKILVTDNEDFCSSACSIVLPESLGLGKSDALPSAAERNEIDSEILIRWSESGRAAHGYPR